MLRNFIILVIAAVIFISCGGEVSTRPDETESGVTTSQVLGTIVAVPLFIALLPFIDMISPKPGYIPDNLRNKIHPSCTIYYCKEDHCGSNLVYIKSGKPDINIEEFLQDTIPEKTHHNCPVEN